MQSADVENSASSQFRKSRNKRSRRRAQAGIALLGVGAVFQVAAVIDTLHWHNGFLPLEVYLIGSLCLLTCAALFLLDILLGGKQCRLRNNVCLSSAICILLITWVVLPVIGTTLEGKRLDKTKLVILKLVSEIEPIRSRISRLPKDESEVVKLRGQSMPVSAWRTPITYWKDPNSAAYEIRSYSSRYSLISLYYNSDDPNKGVIVYEPL